MKIERDGSLYVIRRGVSYFCFFVDDDGSCWTSRPSVGRTAYANIADAEAAIKELKRRAALKAARRRERFAASTASRGK